MFLATEDELSEAVGRRLAAEHGVDAEAIICLRKGGNGYLRSRMDAFCDIARNVPVVLLTDLDDIRCPVDLLNNWRGNRVFPQDLVFRVVVREIEAWLLADKLAFADFLKVSAQILPDNPEDLVDPKRELLAAANRAPRSIKAELIAERHSIASQGLGYNRFLSEFVSTNWCPVRASMNAPSLARARERIDQLIRRHAERYLL